MVQLLYTLIAIMLLGLFSQTMQRGTNATQNKMVLNEVSTHLMGIGADVLEYVGSRAFDENTDESKVPQPPQFPLVTSTGHLTPQASFGGVGSFGLCDDIDDFHGLTITRTVGGLTYTVQITVLYVDPLTLASTGGNPSYAKEVRLTLSNPHLLLGGQPVQVNMSRIFTYDRITSP